MNNEINQQSARTPNGIPPLRGEVRRGPRFVLAISSFIIAVVLVVVNMLMPPPGKVDESIIYVFAQLLLYSATLLGVQLLLQNHKKER